MTTSRTTTVRTRYFHAGLGGAKIIVKSAAGQRTIPYNYGARDAHLDAVDRYADELLGVAGLRTIVQIDSNDSGTRRRYSIEDVEIDYSRDSDERHPDNCANCAGDLEDHDTEQLQTCIREHLTALGV